MWFGIAEPSCMMSLDEGDLIELSASMSARLVVVTGKQHGEEIVLGGSFVY
jgi:hypothetical protein